MDPATSQSSATFLQFVSQ